MRSVVQDAMVSTGLDFDTHESLFGKGSHAFLLNGDTTGFENAGNSSFVQNVLSNELCFKIPQGYELLCAAKLNKSQFTLFFKVTRPDDTLSSEIGLFDADTCAYVAKVNDPCLGLSSAIKATYKTLSGCDSRRVYWVEDGKPIRFIDIDECLPTKDVSSCFDCEKELVFDCDAFNLNRCVTFPEISLTEGLGNLPNGSYQIALALTDNEQRFTEYYVYPQIIRFHTNNQGSNRFGVEIDFTTCPKGFEQYELVLISHRTDRGTLAQRVGYFGVEQTKILISEIDDTSYSPVDLSVLAQIFPHYQSARGIAQNSEQLLLSGVSFREAPNYQPKANKVTAKWVEYKVRARDAHKYKSFMRGEVYSFEVRGVYCDNERTPTYHIPGDAEFKIKENRESGQDIWDNLFTPVTNSDNCAVDDLCDPQTVYNWQVYDSSSVDEGFGPDPLNDEFCVVIDSGEYQQVSDQCYGEVPSLPFTRIENFVSIQVKNQYCELVPSSEDITIEAEYETTNCFGVTSTYTLTHVLPAGQSFFNYTYVSFQKVDCGTGNCLDESTSLLGISIVTSHLDECSPRMICEDRIDPCGGTVTKTGDFGHWESTLQYPDNPCIWGQRDDPEADYYDPYGLSCQKIRYHKFPDNCTTHIHDDKGCSEEEFVNILGVEFYNIQPFTDQDGNPIPDIVGIEILVTDRANHKSILHKGLLYNMWEEKLSDCSTSYYPNYPFNDLNPDPFLSTTPATHSVNWLLDDFLDPLPFYETGFTPASQYSKAKFEYLSPEVSYERNDAGQYIQIFTEENGPVAGQYSYTREMPEVLVLSDADYLMVVTVIAASALLLDFDGALNMGQALLNGFLNTLKPKQYATNYYAKTQYRGYNCENIVPGNQRRKINISQYTLPTKMLIGENKVNNYQRESGLFLDLCFDVLDPYIKERSRIRHGDNFCKPSFSFCEMTALTERPITSSYYVGVKVERPSQYGLPGSCLSRVVTNVIAWDNNSTLSTGLILGGDIYITKHKHIRKMPFFTNLPLDTPPKTEYDTKPYMNVWHTRYWFNPSNATSVALLAPFTLASAFAYSFNNDRNLEETGSLSKTMCGNDSESCANIDIFRVMGTFYTHVIGEVEYWCESDYIGGYRELNEIPESDIERPLEQKIEYRTVQYPELYLYNRQYHWKGFSPFVQHSDIDYDCCRPNKRCDINTIAYSVAHDPLSKGDTWTKFLPANFQQFSGKDGELIGIKEIDNYNLLLFFEDALYLTQQEDTLKTENGQIYLGSPNLFSRRMKKISDDATGFGGCMDIDSVVSCRYGVFWFDRKRGYFCTLGNNMAEDATGNIQSWLAKFLVGPVSGVYDNFTDNIYYTGEGPNGCRWTISFKPKQFLSTPEKNGWVGFHSFTPEVWLQTPTGYLTSNGEGIWKHNKLYDFGKYYGRKYPFEIGAVLKNKTMAMPQYLEVWSEWAKYDDYGKKRFNPKAFFDQILVYNNLRTTGYQNIVVKDLNNENYYGVQNRTDLVEASAVEDFTYRINKFATQSTYQPTTEIGCMEVTSSVVPNVSNPDSEPMRGKWVKVHLRSNENDHKILIQTETLFQDDISQ
jgi:hypothetical protein